MSLDAPEDLPKQTLRQVALGQLEDEVPGMPDETPADLEEPLQETRQGLLLRFADEELGGLDETDRERWTSELEFYITDLRYELQAPPWTKGQKGMRECQEWLKSGPTPFGAVTDG